VLTLLIEMFYYAKKGGEVKKLYVFCLTCLISGCVRYEYTDEYVLKKLPGYEIPVCVNNSKLIRQDSAWLDIARNDTEKTNDTGSVENNSYQIVSYSYCLARLPKQVHLVEKREKDMTICYDRNNKVELPILYCQKDINIYQIYQ